MRAHVTGLGGICGIAADPEGLATALRQGRRAQPAVESPSQTPTSPWLGVRLQDDGEEQATDGLPAPLRDRLRKLTARASRPVRLAAIASAQAWQRSGLEERRPPASRIGVVVGGHNLTVTAETAAARRLAASPGHVSGRHAVQFMDTHHVGVISELLDARGEGCTVGGASASGNVAIAHGLRMIRAGAADVCIVVGALTELSAAAAQALFNLGGMAGRAGGCPNLLGRPFASDAEGFVPGEAVGALILEHPGTAPDAVVIGSVLGAATRLDGTASPAPDLHGQVAAMRAALADAAVLPDTVGYVSAHATGTPLGDTTELAAIEAVFGPRGPWVNATKGLIGHGLCAAGVVEAVATLLQLRDGLLHPNPAGDDVVPTDCRLVGARPQQTRAQVAVSNAFGFGGFSTSIVLERSA